MLEFIVRTDNNFALLENKSVNDSGLVIFIHGFWGGYLKTWGKIPNLLQAVDSSVKAPAILRKWDYLFLGYKTGNVETYIDISKILKTNIEDAFKKEKPFNKKYKKITLVGHSLGTLGIRQLLCDYSIHPNGFLNKLHNIVLLGTPINGSFLAHFPFWEKVSESLKPNNPQLRMLNSWTKTTYSFVKWPLARVVLGTDDKIVGHKYGNVITWNGDAAVRYTGLNHKKLVQASGYHSTFFDILINALK